VTILIVSPYGNLAAAALRIISSSSFLSTNDLPSLRLECGVQDALQHGSH
jgi:hypothetical protein